MSESNMKLWLKLVRPFTDSDRFSTVSPVVLETSMAPSLLTSAVMPKVNAGSWVFIQSSRSCSVDELVISNVDVAMVPPLSVPLSEMTSPGNRPRLPLRSPLRSTRRSDPSAVTRSEPVSRMLPTASESESRFPIRSMLVEAAAGTTRPGSMYRSLIGPVPISPSASAMMPCSFMPVLGLTR